MDNYRHRRARLVLVTGFLLSAVGAVVRFVRQASSLALFVHPHFADRSSNDGGSGLDLVVAVVDFADQ
jgi:hypothetical protein